MSNLNPEDLPIEAKGSPQSNSISTAGNIQQIVVPAALVARSRPSGHSVPITHAKHKLKRSHPYRNMMTPCLVAVVALIGLTIAVDYSVEAGRAAGYQLVCPVVGGGKGAVRICRWETN
jgi:hypothetical protein